MRSLILILLISVVFIFGFGASGRGQADAQYVVFAWNDLGMHCLNPTYDTAVLLPPYNTLWAQIVYRGNPPRIVTAGITVEYRVLNNKSSANKGLNLDDLNDPAIRNGLSGTMTLKTDHFQANGIPLTPVDDSGAWNPYQVSEVTVKNSSGRVIAQTRTTIPTSDEINCVKCHNSEGTNITKVFSKSSPGTIRTTARALLLILKPPFSARAATGAPMP